MSKLKKASPTPQAIEDRRQSLLRRYALHPMTEETKQKISQGNKGKIRTPEWCRYISEGKRGAISAKKGIPQPSSSYKRSDETKSKMSESRKVMFSEHPEMRVNLGEKLRGRIFSQETRQRMSETRKRYFTEHPEARLKISLANKGKSKKSKTRSQTHKRLWQDPSHVLRMMKARNIQPNKQELKLEGLLQTLCPNQFKYNGDCRLGVVLNGYIPDFVNVNGKKQVIEFFGDYWHRDPSRGENDRLDRYHKIGWDCLVVWGSELEETDALTDKIRAFVGGEMSV